MQRPNPYAHLQHILSRPNVPAPSYNGVKYGIPGPAMPQAGSTGPWFVVDENGATFELLGMLLAGDRASGSLIAASNGGGSVSSQLQPGTAVVLPKGMSLPSWQDLYAPDSFGRSNLNYWTGRALEAAFNALGSVMGVVSSTVCTLGKDGKPGECCDPTSDPFPSKPYFYVVPFGKTAQDVARDFGRDNNGWIELRRANADDPDGFVKQENRWCYWKVWVPGKRLRIPGSWPEDQFTPDVLPHLRDGNGRPFKLEEFANIVTLFRSGMPAKWETPIHMLIECGKALWLDPAVRPGLDVDPEIAKQIITRNFSVPAREVSQPRPQPQPQEQAKPMPLVNLDAASLEQFVDQYPVSVVRFHAPWCSACQMFGPIFKAVSQQLPNLAFGELNVDANPAASQRYQISSLPTTIIFRAGKIVDRHSGGMQPQNFASWLVQALK